MIEILPVSMGNILSLLEGPVWHHLPSEGKEYPFDGIGYQESLLLPDSLSKPIVKAQVLVNQKTSHLFFPGFIAMS